jgi:hypothetical protein
VGTRQLHSREIYRTFTSETKSGRDQRLQRTSAEETPAVCDDKRMDVDALPIRAEDFATDRFAIQVLRAYVQEV